MIYKTRTATIDIDGEPVTFEFRPVPYTYDIAVHEASGSSAAVAAIAAVFEASIVGDAWRGLALPDFMALYKAISSPSPKGSTT
jgi:hypothetical protein